MITADKATLMIGDLGLECLMFPDGTYHFYINQLNEKLGIKASDKSGKKYVQPLLQANPNQVNKVKVKNIKTPVKTISLDLVAQLIGVYAEMGNKRCQAISYACIAEALDRRADRVFGIQRTEHEREERLKLRFKSKLTRRSYTDILKEVLIKQYGEETYKELSQKGYFKEVTVRVNQSLFGVDHFKCNRDNMTDDQLVEIECFEKLLARRAKRCPNQTADQLLQWMLDNY